MKNVDGNETDSFPITYSHFIFGLAKNKIFVNKTKLTNENII